MLLKQFYDQAFIQASKNNKQQFEPSPSLEDLANHPLMSELRIGEHSILEVGCGASSIFSKFKEPEQNVLAVDFSMAAINLANKEEGIDYRVLDVTEPWGLNKTFDVIFDAHCIHCLTSREGRRHYLNEVKNHLNPRGRFFIESMVSCSDMEFPDDFLYLDNEETLLQQIGEHAIAVRYIPEARNLENEFLNAGFQIDYFKVRDNKKVIPHNRRDYAFESDPSSLMAVLSLPKEG